MTRRANDRVARVLLSSLTIGALIATLGASGATAAAPEAEETPAEVFENDLIEQGEAPPAEASPAEEVPTEDVEPFEEAPAPEPAEAPNTITVEGQLLVVPTEAMPVELDEHGHAAGLPEVDIAHEAAVILVSENGERIELQGHDEREYVTGQPARATFAVPEAVQGEVQQQLDERPELAAQQADGSNAPDLLELVVDAAEALELPLEAISTEVQDAPIEVAAVGSTHPVDLLFVGSPGSHPSNAAITDHINRLSAFWKSESGGKVAGFSLQNMRKISVPGGGFCQAGIGEWPFLLWDRAAQEFGRDVNSYWRSGNRHLIVMQDAAACGGSHGSGLGTVGAGPTNGGLAWGTYQASKPLEWDRVTFHETGHNFSLGHSNELSCSSGVFDSATISAARNYAGQIVRSASDSRCTVREYWDIVDVMGLSFLSAPGNSANVPALSATHRLTIGALPGSDVRYLDSRVGTQTIDLKPATNANGVRAISIADPVTGQRYLLEYRNGQGRDANSLYTKWRASYGNNAFGPGVRVLRQTGFKESIMLNRPRTAAELSANGNEAAVLHQLSKGASFTGASGKMRFTVTDITSTNAKIQVSFPGVGVRVEGADRYTTAVAVSKRAYPSTTGGTVIIATGTNYPDSLSAAPLAAKRKAPLLLAKPAELPASTKAEIQRLAPKEILIVGGPGAIGTGVENQLKALVSDPKKVRRLAGADRYATSEAIAREGWKSGSGVASTNVFIATGESFADALSLGAAAGGAGAPVVLVPGSKAAPPANVQQLLTDLKPTRAYIAGGTGAVSSSMEGAVRSSLTGAKAITRFSGIDRHDTSSKIGQAFNTPKGTVYLATGEGFADALAGAAVAGTTKSPLLLTKKDCLPKPVNSVRASIAPSSSIVLGGTGVVAESVRVHWRVCA